MANIIFYILKKITRVFAPTASAAIDPTKSVSENFALPAPPPFVTGGWTNRLIAYLGWFVGLFWVITVAFVFWAAFMFLTAGGDEDKIKEAKLRLKYALIAGAVALVASGIDLIAYNLLSGTIS